MRQFAFSLFLTALTTLSVHAYKQQQLDINVNGQQRNMVIFTPNQLPANSPLFIVTHGMNQNPEYQYGSDKMYEMIDTAKFVIAYLRSDGNTWDIGGTKDQNFVIRTIDEMASRYNIDTNRVYWSGFSMGSMLIHHCIGAMQDKIAAFAPTSGIQFSEQPWNNCRKPVNLLEVIAYGDDVFGYEQYGIHDYIENYAKHDKHTNYVKLANYKPIASSWYNGDLEKWTGGPNGGEVWLYSYNNGGHWPMDLNRHLIWNFCKRFSLNPTQPTVKFTAPTTNLFHLFMAPADEVQFPDIALRASASDHNGKIAKVDFYDGKELIDSKTSTPFQTTLTNPTAADHTLRVIATDNDGETASATCQATLVTAQRSYNFVKLLSGDNNVPEGWNMVSGAEKRNGGSMTYADGPRAVHFTATTRGFEYGLLVQNGLSRAKASWAKFGVKAAGSTLSLYPGHYTLKYKICNWNKPEFTPVTICIEKRNGQEVASQEYTPTVNIGGDVANKFGGVRQQEFEFDIPATGEYVIAIYTGPSRGDDFVLGQLILTVGEFYTTGIRDLRPNGSEGSAIQPSGSNTFDILGRHLPQAPSKPGIYVIDGRKKVVK